MISVGGNYIFNNELKRWLKGSKYVHWHVGAEGEVCDPFWNLTQIFEMPEEYFFSQLSAFAETNKIQYVNIWKELSQLPKLPDMHYCEFYAITSLMEKIPENADLQLANSQTIRMSQYIPLKDTVRVNCNRGVNGIDGSLSTAVGFSADNNRPLYYITGELSFFYDMNALSIKHLSPKMRILLINNKGGAVMYDQPKDTPEEKLPIYLAAGRNLTAKGWAESLGFKYLSANSKEKVDSGVKELIADNERPVILEVFTKLADDRFCIDDYLKTLDRRSFIDKVEGRLRMYVNKITHIK